MFHIHSQISKLNASDFIEDDDKNDVNDVIDETMKWWFRLKGKFMTTIIKDLRKLTNKMKT